jgi:hypothetical protein
MHLVKLFCPFWDNLKVPHAISPTYKFKISILVLTPVISDGKKEISFLKYDICELFQTVSPILSGLEGLFSSLHIFYFLTTNI